jgi:hypothetical protein
MFISHAWSYTDEYHRIVGLLDSAANFSYYNYSVPKADPVMVRSETALEEALRRQIRPVHAVLILAGMYVAHSRWIQFEIDFARVIDKPIIGVVPWGGQRTPTAVTNAADTMVAWNTASIVLAIRQYSL